MKKLKYAWEVCEANLVGSWDEIPSGAWGSPLDVGKAYGFATLARKAEVMKIVFMGTPSFALPCLEALYKAHEVVGVVSQPAAKVGRGGKLVESPVALRAAEMDVPLLQPSRLRAPETMRQLEELGADLFVVVAYGRILPKMILEIPKLGCINVHASVLPSYRGAAPIQHALINGEEVTGVTIMKMDEGLDTGDMLLVRKEEIIAEDTSETLHKRLAHVGAGALLEVLEMMECGTLDPQKQDDSRATLAPPITQEMARINWDKSPREIVNLVRGLNPNPVAWTMLGDTLFKVYEAEEAEGIEAGIGSIAWADKKNGLIVGASGGGVRLCVLQRQGGKILGDRDFMNGNRLSIGETFA